MGKTSWVELLGRRVAVRRREEWLETCPHRLGVMRIREAREQVEQGKRGGSRLRRTSLLRPDGNFEGKTPQLNQILMALGWLALQIEGKESETLAM